MSGPLSDLRVIAVEQFGAGPWATMQLADLGADVIKIEDPRSGDVGRYVPPLQDGEDSMYFEAFNRGKRSLSLDLRLPRRGGPRAPTTTWSRRCGVDGRDRWPRRPAAAQGGSMADYAAGYVAALAMVAGSGRRAAPGAV